jgi:hypothetical protein
MRTFLSRLGEACVSGLVIALVFTMISFVVNCLEWGWAGAWADWRRDSGFKIGWFLCSWVVWTLFSLASAYWRAWRGPRWWD